MMDNLRFATETEINAIREKSDLDPRVPTTVIAFSNGPKFPDIAVLKNVAEMDPVHFAEGTTPRRMQQFMWALTNHLRLTGLPVVYFEIDADNLEWQDIAKNFGAEQVTPVASLRFKITLNEVPPEPQLGNQDNNNK